MNQVESVSFWVGLISSIVGIVLSLVAIVFSVLVDRRSSTISDRTIQSLQKIESAVERSSSDTRDLIKAGWDKMLGNVERGPVSSVSDTSAKEVAAGIAAELRSELQSLNPGKNDTSDDSKRRVDQLEKYIKDLEASLVSQLKSAHSDIRPSAKFDEISEMIRQLTEPAYALLAAIRHRHLTQSQYRNLSSGAFASSVLELRRSGLLVPVVHQTSHGPEPCYYMPSGSAQLANAAMQVLPKPNSALIHAIAEELTRVGYPSRNKASDLSH
jgi:hypothetical protein